MEQMLQNILEEVKGVKKEVQETKIELRSEIRETESKLRGEIQDTETRLRGEIQDTENRLRTELSEVMDKKLEETKTEIREEMDVRFAKQSREIANELQQIMIFQERKDNKFYEEMTRMREEQAEILKDIRRLQTDSKGYDYRINKLEDALKVS